MIKEEFFKLSASEMLEVPDEIMHKIYNELTLEERVEIFKTVISKNPSDEDKAVAMLIFYNITEWGMSNDPRRKEMLEKWDGIIKRRESLLRDVEEWEAQTGNLCQISDNPVLCAWKERIHQETETLKQEIKDYAEAAIKEWERKRFISKGE